MGKNFFARKNFMSSATPTVTGTKDEPLESKKSKRPRSNKENLKPSRPKSRSHSRQGRVLVTPKVERKRIKDKAKQKSENNRSVRKMKKNGMVRQMLQKFPKESPPKAVGGTSNEVSVAPMESHEIYAETVTEVKEKSTSPKEQESNYASRKLLIRQMQGMIAKNVHGDAVSEYDSWTDLEENFAMAYEPIPLDIHIDTWRKMSKNDIIKTVRSNKMKKDFEYMSRSEILVRIEKMQKSAKYLSAKFGVDHLLPQLDHVAQVHREDESPSDCTLSSDDSDSDMALNLSDSAASSNFSANVKDYVSRSEILKVYQMDAKVNGRDPGMRMTEAHSKRSPVGGPVRKEEVVHGNNDGALQQRSRKHDSWSSRASSILNNPEQIYVSRGEVLKNLHHPKVAQPPPPQENANFQAKASSRNGVGGKAKKLPNKRDSWSSHASTIMANHQKLNQGGQRKRGEPNYVSRAELLDKLADLAYDTLSNQAASSDEEMVELDERQKHHEGNGDNEDDNNVNDDEDEDDDDDDDDKCSSMSKCSTNTSKSSESEASTVKNVVLKSQRLVPNTLINRTGAKGSSRNPTPTDKSINDLSNEQSIERSQSAVKASSTISVMASNAIPHASCDVPISNGTMESYSTLGSDCDTCSCSSCESYTNTNCSCCYGEEPLYSCTSSHSSYPTLEYQNEERHDSSNYGRDKRNINNPSNLVKKEVYVVNGSEGSKLSKKSGSKSSKRSHESKKSELFPKNSVKQVALLETKSHTSIDTSSKHSGKSEKLRDPMTVQMSSKEKVRKWDVNSKWDAKEGKDFEKIYEPVHAKEIQKQRNQRLLKKHLRDLASDWDSRINDLNTLRRGQVLKDLKKYLREAIDFENTQPDEINRQVEVLLRKALDSNFEALSNRNIGQMYVPMEDQLAAKVLSRETTDYDTFGSIDSLIFEPKTPSQEDIKEVQDEIEQQFEYLNHEDCGGDSQDDYKTTPKQAKAKKKLFSGPGKTTFAERVKLFQNLGRKSKSPKLPPAVKPPTKKITFLDVSGQETSWKELAEGRLEAKPRIDNNTDQEDFHSNTLSHESAQDGTSLCPDCNNPYDMSLTTVCSTCYCCTQCDLEEATDENQRNRLEDVESNTLGKISYNYSSATASWNFLNSSKEDEDEEADDVDDPEVDVESDSSFSAASVINTFVSKKAKESRPVMDLRRQLKDTFGAPSASPSPEMNEPGRPEENYDIPRSPSMPVPLDKLEDVKMEPPPLIHIQPEFLQEYATRQSLFKEAPEPAVLVRGNETVALTEEMFRGELRGTLKKIHSNHHNGRKCKNQGSEMGDSGIASPPAAPSLVPTILQPSTVIEAEEHKEDQSDSGLDESGEKKVAIPGMKKRDTMIRELKNKLKEKFNVESSTSSSENNSITVLDSPDKLPIGNVESRRETMGPKLAKLFSHKLVGGVPGPVPVFPMPKAPSPPPLPKSSTISSKTSGQTLITMASNSSNHTEDGKVATTTFKSIFESRIEKSVSPRQGEVSPSDYESSVYDPSLPDELKKSVPAGVMFRGHRPFTPPNKGEGTKKSIPTPPSAKGANGGNLKYLSSVAQTKSVFSGICKELNERSLAQQLANAPSTERREFLYGPGGIFGPKGPFSTPSVRYPHGLEVSSPNVKRNVRFEANTEHKPVNAIHSISDSSSAMAEDRSVKSQYVANSVIIPSTPILKTPTSRMATYRAEWADQECSPSKPSKPLVPEDLERWREEKARRMLAWINNSQLTGYWGSDTPWWKAKQRASIKWLLSKAYSHKTPPELSEPFYKDHDDVDHLKPHIVHALANAELYCMALSILYSDPNYHNLNHWGIIQALARKGIYVAEPADCALTETVLIQTNPLKMSAHMAVTEAVMGLVLKETVNIEKVKGVVQRLEKAFSLDEQEASERAAPSDQEEALVLWVNTCCEVVRKQAEEQLKGEDHSTTPKFPKVQDLSDLSDGVGLAVVISLYCPDELAWTEIALGDPPSMADSLYNIQLVQRFCQSTPSFNPCHLSIEDFVYLHASIKQNVICFMADLFNILEVKPIRPAKVPGVPKNQVIEVPDPALEQPSSQRGFLGFRGLSQASGGIIPHLRPSLDSPEPTGLRTDMHRAKSPHVIRRQASSQAEKNEPLSDSSFVVQRGKAVPTLSSVARSGSPTLEKEHLNTDTKSEERGEAEASGDDTPRGQRSGSVFDQMRNIPVAGRPSTQESPTRGYKGIAGRRSRRNSVDENTSQLSLENLGGSQDNIHLLSRNPDKEMKTHSGRLGPDNNRYVDNREIEELEKHAREAVGEKSAALLESKVSFADLRKQKARDQFHSSGINITYMHDEKEDLPKQRRPSSSSTSLQRSNSQKDNPNPGMTSWSNPGANQMGQIGGQSNNEDPSSSPDAMASQLNNVRMKLEQRRKKIEEEKKKMESIMSKQREKKSDKTPISTVALPSQGSANKEIVATPNTTTTAITTTPKRPVTFKDLTEDISAVQSRWLSSRGSKFGDPTGSVRTPDIENMDMDTYTKSLHAMNDSLHELQTDIHRLASQQTQIQHMMHQPGARQDLPTSRHPMDPQPFYIAHEAQQGPPRRTWGQPQPINFAHQGSAMGDPGHGGWQSPQRQQWGQRPMSNQGGYGYGPPSSQYNDPYGQPYQMQNPMYNGHAPFDQPYGYGGMAPPTQSFSPGPNGYGQGPYGNNSYMSPPPQSNMVNPMAAGASPSRATPFRLHDKMGGSGSPVPVNNSVLSRTPAYGSGVGSPASPLRGSDPSVTSGHHGFGSTQSLSRQVSRDSVNGGHLQPMSPPSGEITRRLHSSVPAPEEDDMAPQNISFIEDTSHDEGDRRSSSPVDPLKRLPERLSQLNISSGSKTYRVHSSPDKEPSPSPTRTRPTISSTFKQARRSSGGENPLASSGPSSIRSNTGQSGLTEEEAETLSQMKTERLKDGAEAAKGFVITFEDDTPKKPKPQLKQRRPSSKRNSMVFMGNELNSDGSNSSRKENVPPEVMICIDMNMGAGEDGTNSGSSTFRKYSPGHHNGGSPTRNSMDSSHWKSYENDNSTTETLRPVIPRFDIDPDVPLENMVALQGTSESESDGQGKTKALLIGDELLKNDPVAQDEMQKKKERIMMQSLRRKQQAEENRIKAEEEARARREEENQKEEEKLRKKEEEKARRDAILEQHRLKKEMEKAEEEGRYMPKPVSARPVPKLRSASTMGRRPRPKTIHVDQDADLNQALGSNRGSRGSTSNMSGLPRSESRNSINDLHDGGPTTPSRHHLGLSAMGTGRSNRPVSRPTSRPPSRGPSRRGSTQYLNEEPSNANLPPSGMTSRTMDWAARQAAAARRRQSQAPDESPRVSRLDRSTRSVSQPRGKRDSSVSSAYGGGRDFRGSRESLASGLTYNPRRGSNASIYEETDYYYGGSMRDLSGRTTGRRKSSSASHLDLCSYRAPTSASSARSGVAALGSLRSLSHFNSLKRGAGTGPLIAGFTSASHHQHQSHALVKSRSFANLCGHELSNLSNPPLDDSGRGTSATPTLVSPKEGIPAGPGPGSLPGYRRRAEFDDGASDISSASGFSAFGFRSGTRLYREPTSKSNRTIVLNAIEYVVFPGAVNRDTRERVLDVIDRCDCPHFLLLFRDQKCQFRGLYAYFPDTEEVYKIYGTGPKQVTSKMFDHFFKYNSGGKKFTKIHTKSLTVTIDAFTIHNSLWLGKKAKLPDKQNMALVV